MTHGGGRGRCEVLDDVTSDVSLRARGESLEAAFTAAADGLLSLTVENPEAVAARETRAVRLEEEALDLLLLRFLNELVYLRDAEGLLLRVASLAIRRDGSGGTALEARLEGETFDASRHEAAGEVKATTAHGLAVAPCPEGWEARFTVDV